MNLEEKNNYLKSLVQKVNIDNKFQYATDSLLEEKIKFLSEKCRLVIDFGKSSRAKYSYFRPEQIKTVDINKYNDYPDVIDDICDLQNIPDNFADGVICNAVLEHVYDPQIAVKNIYKILQPGGYCLAFAPFLYRYHAPDDLKYQDFYRFTKDGIAYLFRDFSEITLYTVRGRFSTMLNLTYFWKPKIEKKFGEKINRLIDTVLGGEKDKNQVAGFFIWAKK